ncbi:hypothetical protein SLEP1_g22654 [Rubroshorea leprosula]|uniref:Uncharacterized protein n=1 Tax=Rubroshorea leprosula TaxID=152421 RepID=A0AAV5JF80_9ROSI|nr:hypothetical protein SLEP1_g22654 [Rubroshorea leprosula]
MEGKTNPWLVLCLLFLYFSLNPCVSSGADTISINQSLYGDKTIVSGGGVFELGFFNPAVLGDDENLVLRNGPNSMSYLWQSFDFPTDTWLPGMKIRFDKKTHHSQLLTSWKNSKDPAPGLFSLNLDPDGSNSYILLWNRSEQYWTSGPWDWERKFFSLVPEMRLNNIHHFSHVNFVNHENESYFTYTLYNSSTISRFILDFSGQVMQLSWMESTQKWISFWSEPRQQCEVYAFCGAFGSCNEKALLSVAAHMGLNATLVNGKSDKVRVNPNMALPEHPKTLVAGSIKECESACLKNCSCTAYTYESNGCTESAGLLLFALMMLVLFSQKKRTNEAAKGKKQFHTEGNTIGTIQHVNHVRLRGFCSEGMRKSLVYDYMSNGSLDTHLFHEEDWNVVDWETRDCIIDCDIKPENILLDAEFYPKVADFGLAKLVGRDFSRVLTTMRGTRGYLAPEWIAGVAITTKVDVYSYGMMLFEFVSGRRNSEQTTNGKVQFFPTWVASIVTQGGDVLSLLDPRLHGNNANIDEISRICKVACWCIQDDETRRPSMGQVVQIREGACGSELAPNPQISSSVYGQPGAHSFLH